MAIVSPSWFPPSGEFHEIDGSKSKNPSLNLETILPTLHSSDYYTIPSLSELSKSEKSNPGFCTRVPNFKIGKFNFGHLKFTGFTDISSLNLDQIVKFESNSITVYPNETNKPPLGQGLNKPAEVTLILQLPISQGPNCKNIVDILKSCNEKQGAQFISFDPCTFEWKFNVDHFSRFGLDDISDDEEEGEEETEEDDIATRPVNDPLVSSGYQNELSRSFPSILRLDLVKMQEIRMLMIPNLDEEESEDEIRAPFTQLPSNRKYNRNPKPNPNPKPVQNSPISNSKGKGLAFGSPIQKPTQKSKEMYNYNSPSSSKSPQPLLEYNLNGSDLDPLRDSSPSSTILLTGQKSDPSLHLSKVIGFKINQENSHKTPILNNNNLSNCIVDAGLFLGRSFRAGWGPNGVLIHSGNPITNNNNNCLSSIIHIERVALDKITRDKTGKINPKLIEYCFESPLNFHRSLEHEIQEIETSDKKSLKLYKLITDVTLLEFISHNYIEILGKIHTVNNLENYSHISLIHNTSVWDLIKALFFENNINNNIDDEMILDINNMNDINNEPDLDALPFARRASFSYFLQEYVNERVNEQISFVPEQSYLEQILLLLTGRQLDEAAELAVSKGDVRLAILISQANGSVSTRLDVKQQLDLWKVNGLDFEFFEKDRVKILELLGGDVHNAVRELNVDWVRYLGLIMWYQLSPDTPVRNIIQHYQQLLSEEMVPDPVPVYLEDNEISGIGDKFDILYYLMLLHANYDSGEDLNGLIKVMFSALSSSNDPMDHHMIWHYKSVLESIGVIKLSDYSKNDNNNDDDDNNNNNNNSNNNNLGVLDMSFVYQLLGLGLVQWAVYVVLHMNLEDYYMHEKIIKEILGRYVEIWSKDVDQIKFIEDIGVPKEWMHEASAIYSEYYGDKTGALEHYLECASWQRAHMIFMTSAAHSLYLSSKHSEIWRITTKMELHKSEIPNWDLGAGIYINFYDLRTLLQEENTMTDSDPLEEKREACKSFFDRLNESIIIWGNKLPLDARVVYAKMSEELNGLLMATPGDGSTSDIPINCFDTMLSAPLPEDNRSYQLQEALSVFTYLISNES